MPNQTKAQKGSAPSSVDSAPLFHTIEDAARILAISTVTLRRLVWAGEIAHARIGRSVRIPADVIQDFAARVRVEATGGER
jgi:excisionase family DNA binding protein